MLSRSLLSLAFSSILAFAAPTARQTCQKKVFDLTDADSVLSDFVITSGSQSAITANATGLTLQITKDTQNLVLNSATTYGPPLTLGVTMEGTAAPGVIPCVVVWNGESGQDEIDLELLGGSPNYFMAPIWANGQKPAYNSQVKVDTDYAAPDWDYVYAPPDDFDSKKQHYYEMHWDGDTISWSINDVPIVTYGKKTEAWWLTSTTNIRLGLWATESGSDWAGVVDWETHPEPTALIRWLTVTSGC